MDSPEYALPLLTTEHYSDGQRIVGPVHAVAVVSKSLVGDFVANIKNWSVGGELPPYVALVDSAVTLAMQRLAERARAIGADAVVGVRLCSTEVAAGAAEVIAYGTAIRLAGARTEPS